MIRKLAAHYIFPASEKPIKNGIITVDEKGKILDISQSTQKLKEIAGLEFYSGVLIPGFVNTHCHLELSHMKGKIPMHTGLPGFVSKINQLRKSEAREITEAVQKADKDMWYNGIAAVGDISNTNHSFEIKFSSKILYHTLLEIFTTNPAMVEKQFAHALQLKNELNNKNLKVSVIPHAPYSVTPAMFKLINNHFVESGGIISIHNQECPSENDLYQSKSGQLYDIFTSLGVSFDSIPLTGKNSLESVMPMMPIKAKTLLVHNTYTKKEDIEKAGNYFEQLFWCMCPNANLYIENNLPDIPLFMKMGQKITIGTDSLASNQHLSILEELKTIQANFPEIPFEELIKWACLNGAEAIDLQDKKGSFELGKIPGISHLRQFDIQNLRLKPESNLKRLI